MSLVVENGSFRDPSGVVFYRDGQVYRHVQNSYQENYDLLMLSGLYSNLIKAQLLVNHSEVENQELSSANAYRTLQPDMISYISYPYEWSFSQLKDAALTTLKIQKLAIEFGMSLKDASAYNIQFQNGKPIFIDTLSFEKYVEGSPWVAYKQFCEHFLAPLALMSRTDIRLGQLLRNNLDGIPLDLASKLLPKLSLLNSGLLTHLHLHGAASKRFEGKSQSAEAIANRVSKTAMLGLVDNLETTIKKLTWLPYGTTWADYYQETNYSDPAMDSKKRLVGRMLDSVTPTPKSVWDLGANTGVFSRIANERGFDVIAWDIDPAAVERNYLDCKAGRGSNLLPLMIDLTNPSPDQGWALQERRSYTGRGLPDVAMALALIHHLAIGNNVPLKKTASFFSALGKWLIIEFVPKSDSQVKRLLAAREDVFPNYDLEHFERDFEFHFEIVMKAPVLESERTLFLMRNLSCVDVDR